MKGILEVGEKEKKLFGEIDSKKCMYSDASI